MSTPDSSMPYRELCTLATTVFMTLQEAEQITHNVTEDQRLMKSYLRSHSRLLPEVRNFISTCRMHFPEDFTDITDE